VSRFLVALVPVGKIDITEVEAAALRAAKALRQPLELRESVPVPRGAEDAGRGQHRAAVLLAELKLAAEKMRPGRLVGVEGEAGPAAARPGRPDAFVFITDVDLYTAQTEGVLGAVNATARTAVVSLRRLREVFYRRKADPGKQRTRLVKELLRMWARLQGLAECKDPLCAVSSSKRVTDVDAKGEQFCRACGQRLFQGTVRI
jgi:predicted Zn-dependent protease